MPRGWRFLYARWLRNALRAKMACTFSTSRILRIFRTWDLFSFFASKRASRYNGVQLFISHPTSWLRTRRFSDPTVTPSRATNHWKTPWIAPASSFFWLLLFSDLFFLSSLLLFSSLTLPTSAFPYVRIVGSLTSKLPSGSITPDNITIIHSADQGTRRTFITVMKFTTALLRDKPPIASNVKPLRTGRFGSKKLWRGWTIDPWMKPLLGCNPRHAVRKAADKSM